MWVEYKGIVIAIGIIATVWMCYIYNYRDQPRDAAANNDVII